MKLDIMGICNADLTYLYKSYNLIIKCQWPAVSQVLTIDTVHLATQNATLARLHVISVAAILGWIVMSHRLCSTRSTAQAVMCGAMVCWCMRYGHLERSHFLSFPHQRYIASSLIMGLLFVCVLCCNYIAHRTVHILIRFVRSLRIYDYYNFCIAILLLQNLVPAFCLKALWRLEQAHAFRLMSGHQPWMKLAYCVVAVNDLNNCQ